MGPIVGSYEELEEWYSDKAENEPEAFDAQGKLRDPLSAPELELAAPKRRRKKKHERL